MRLSIIMPYLNSHEIVRRQILNFKSMDLPDDVEILFMDDGSDPPLQTTDPPRNFTIHATNDFRPWTSSLARNAGAKLAKGQYLLMTDGDNILNKEAVMKCREFNGDRLGFRRRFGVLDENGVIVRDRRTLLSYGLSPELFEKRRGWMPPHPNSFVMRAELFQEMGGYREDLVVSRPYPQGEDRWFKRKLRQFIDEGRISLPETDDRPVLFMIPNGQFCGDVDYNPFGLLHGLSRKTENNYWYKHQRYTA